MIIQLNTPKMSILFHLFSFQSLKSINYNKKKETSFQFNSSQINCQSVLLIDFYENESLSEQWLWLPTIYGRKSSGCGCQQYMV